MNNVEFVDRLRKQDPIAAQHLNECFVPSIWRYVFARVNGDRHLAEDIVSESVLALVVAVQKDVEIEFPSAWLRSVASKKIQDHFRAAARVQHLIQQSGLTKEMHDSVTPDSEHDREIRREEVRDVMDRLPEKQRLALEWKYLDRISVREMADRLQATEKSVESILFRARNAFRKAIGMNKNDPKEPKDSSRSPFLSNTTTIETIDLTGSSRPDPAPAHKPNPACDDRSPQPPIDPSNDPTLPNEMLRGRS
ncbi:RNA polymerase sigma factor SigM [Rubripirellula lacrimiformis]|uniref:RNA polymerase sigma factor SigM n=1 Tax=Rubripirellula lacrimiformis TaxID=1930273 RepID=A0A517NBT9_9BACT|nr:sigma-70 family RNA polymerase sigma factor [Rubripirellula lacrimiformis]QDT04605.1 RNA polymerase sigma factor SigM [Rubripirellula lacrimiformis]